jgi:hypothetical protein
MKAMLCILVFVACDAYAALPPKVRHIAVSPRSSGGILRGIGALQGGQAGTGFSILNVKNLAISKKSERLLVEVGDMQMQKLFGTIGYYNVEMKRGNKLVVTFTQTLNSKIESRELKKIFAKSNYIKSSQIHFDPVAQSMSIELNLKKPVIVRVVSLKGIKETGKLVLDMFEAQRR